MSNSLPLLGIISGERRRDHAEVADRAARIASGLHQLGVRQGDSVCILMRNDITFIEAAFAAMRLGAYGVPINWHFKPEEINYILEDSQTSVLIGHADLLHALRGAVITGSIPICSRRLISRSTSNPGSRGTRPITDRRYRSRRT
jgi:long-chain acyl-CoA synthetase